MKVRKLSISVKLIVVLVIMLLISDAVLGFLIYNKSQSMLLEQIKTNGQNMARSMAASIDADALSSIEVGGEESEDYLKVKESLNIFLEYGGAEYAYTIQKTDNGYIYVADSDPEEPASIGDEFDDSGEHLDRAYAGETTTGEPYTDDWGEHISAYSPIKNDAGEVVGLAVIDTSMDWVNEQTSSLLFNIILVCGIVLVVGLLIVIVVVLIMRKKFVLLNNKISDLHDGSGDLTKEVELRSGDEFEVIGDNVNAFIRQIRDLVKNVGASSTEIQSAGVDLSEALATNAGAIDEMTDSITRISANMEECSATSSTAVDHLDLAADQIANFADSMQEMEETVAREHREAEGAAETARKHKEEALAKINSIEEKMVKAIEEARKIDQIKDISDQITSISEQTKMLALNAQIEAARAGEQGRGFAVVATEVESLSNTIGQAVREMNEITTGAIGSVEDLLEQSNEMSKFMIENVAEDYNSFVELGEKYGSSTLSLQESTHSLKESSSGLATSVRDIDLSIQEISKAIADSTNEVESISQSSSDIANSMHELGGISDRNRQQSESLSAEIDMFKC